MRGRAALAMLVLGMMDLFSAAPAAAQDASFGCKVLLCSAATSPGWPSIPYCVPIMQTLFRLLARGGGWPSCAEARTSSIGYERYQVCPEGQTPVRAGEDSGAAPTESRDGGLCADLSKPQQECGAATGCRTHYPTTSRATRRDPHFVDITTENGVQRFYFSLRGY